MTDRPLCVHHHPCADGFSAAWAVWKAFGGNVDFHAGVHGETPPNVAGRHVILVDFSYKAPVILEMAKVAASLLILDHHASAQRELEGLPPAAATWDDHLYEAARFAHGATLDRIGVQFDMNRSGCVMAWDYFHQKKAPRFLLHMQDRDLWQFRMPGTREITSVTFSHPYDFATWSRLVDECEIPFTRQRLIEDGEVLLRQHDKTIAELLPQTKRRMVIGGISVFTANLPYQFASDAAGQMAEGEPFAGCYWDGPEHRNFSLRSRGGIDVSVIASLYGGGGHRNAAGFRVPLHLLVKMGLL